MAYLGIYSVYVVVLIQIYTPLVISIDCYVCTSIDLSDQFCEDSFNTSYEGVDYLQQNCMGYRKDRAGYFPGDHCIKITGSSTRNQSHKIMIRTCALDSGTLTADTELVRMSHCGHFVFDNVQFSGCVQSCHTDGCNSADSIAYTSPLIFMMSISQFFIVQTSVWV